MRGAGRSYKFTPFLALHNCRFSSVFCQHYDDCWPFCGGHRSCAPVPPSWSSRGQDAEMGKLEMILSSLKQDENTRLAWFGHHMENTRFFTCNVCEASWTCEKTVTSVKRCWTQVEEKIIMMSSYAAIQHTLTRETLTFGM